MFPVGIQDLSVSETCKIIRPPFLCPIRSLLIFLPRWRSIALLPNGSRLLRTTANLLLQFVPYSAYKELYNQVVTLTSLVNQLSGAIIESGQNKLAVEVAESCEQLSDMSLIADPLFQQTFSSTDSPALFDPSSKIPPVTSPIAPVATINSLDIAREAAKLLDKFTQVVIERMQDIHDNPKQESEDLDFFQ
ncbi:hypothetical protein GCK72_013115 [Caenorhabditis remanei]|uniref:Uncharacterized protein n=1 Tax=Caenorhabditis remanei TaxID=31234 RepID=A0A6A5GPQ9_CAERE|nr:hypothetical protein GCK72_013115 [Caenorhabditis remanei]KAF1756661.1 hypothetical protein GCK72_013115 [Caenorhabditis remanei]